MQQVRVVPALRHRLGDDATEALTEMVYTIGRDWRDEVLNTTTLRFDNRLAQEISALRVDVTRELATMRV